jgi:hypothetical protein
MEARGYVRDPANADLILSPMIRRDDAEVIADRGQWQDYYYGGYWGYGSAWYQQDLIMLGGGTLIIDAVDVGARDNLDDDALVFRGYATGLLPREQTDVSAQISEAVAEIFKHWPVENARPAQ